MGPQNGIVGNSGMPNNGQPAMPQAAADDSQRKELESAAKFAKSKDYKDLKQHFETRINFYQTYMPDGRPVGAQEASIETAQMWIAANVVIGEFRSIMNVYDNAAEMLKQYTENDATA